MGVTILVDIPDDTVNPSKTQHLFYCFVVRNARFSGLLPVVNEPDFCFAFVVILQPISPVIPIGYIDAIPCTAPTRAVAAARESLTLG